MYALLTLMSQMVQIYIWVIIASAVLSWLVAFDVVNMRNRYVYMFAELLCRFTGPVYSRIRRFLPPMGGLDLAPLVLLLALMFGRNLMWEVFGPMAVGAY